MVESSGKLLGKPPRNDLVPTEPICKLIRWWKSQAPNVRTSEHLDIVMGKPIGWTEDLLFQSDRTRKWVEFDSADEILVAIDRIDAWWSTDLEPYYEKIIFPEQYAENLAEVKERISKGETIKSVAEEKGLNARTLTTKLQKTEKEKEELKRRYKKENTFELAEEFGISPRTLRRIVNGK